MCNCLTVEKRRIGGIILLLIPLVLLTTGCATPYARTWQSQLWQVSEANDPEMAELGQLETAENTFSLICTEFRQVGNPSNALIGIGISCRNDTNETLALQYNTIQVIDASLTIMKPLPLDHVMHRLYGGNLREGAQLAQLAETNTPLSSSGDSFLENVLVGVINAYRAYERGAIITELHKKEALPYNLYYRSFYTNFSTPRRFNGMDGILHRHNGYNYCHLTRLKGRRRCSLFQTTATATSTWR